MTDFERLQAAIGQWGAATFPHATDQSIEAHLEDEVRELANALIAGDINDIAEELADVQHLLFHLAHRHGISLHMATAIKFGENQGRTWAPSERGYWKHVAQPRPTEESE